MNHEDLIRKYRAEREKYQESGDGYSQSKLLGDHYPHCLMVIEGL